MVQIKTITEDAQDLTDLILMAKNEIRTEIPD